MCFEIKTIKQAQFIHEIGGTQNLTLLHCRMKVKAYIIKIPQNVLFHLDCSFR